MSALSDITTFARTGTATFVDSDGVLQTAATGVPRNAHHIWNGSAWVNAGLRFESEARTNLVTFSNDFTDASWVKSNIVLTTSTENSPDGTQNATKIYPFSTGVALVAFAQGGFSANAQVSKAVYFKSAEKGFAYIQVNSDTGGTFVASFVAINLTDGTLGDITPLAGGGVPSASVNVSTLGNGWYRLLFSSSLGASNTATTFFIGGCDSLTTRDWTASGTDGILIYGAQLEAGSTSSSYIPTTGTTVTRNAETLTVSAANLPEIPTEDVTNLLTYSEQFDNAAWVKSSAGTGSAPSVTANAAIAPDGSLTADLVSFDLNGGVTTSDRSFIVQTVSIANATPYVSSFYVKAASASDIGKTIRVSIDGITFGAQITLTSDYQRVGQNGTSGATTANFRIEARGAFTDDEVSVHLWGAQLETGTEASAYVKTEATSVTATLPAPDASYSIQMEGTVNGASSTFLDWQADASNLITLSSGASDFTFTQEQAGTVDSVTGGSYTSGINVPFNIASRHGSTFINGAVDGTALTANTTPTALPGISTADVQIGFDFMGTIKLFRIWAEDIGDVGIASAST